ncbi:hypothetical protein [Mycobacterium nebraskense]|nr:hypothetical protein [Mycobacterium nebraskense]
MADSGDFHAHQGKAAEALFKAAMALDKIDPDDLSPPERITYAQAQASLGVGHALMTQVAQQDQPPLPDRG